MPRTPPPHEASRPYGEPIDYNNDLLTQQPIGPWTFTWSSSSRLGVRLVREVALWARNSHVPTAVRKRIGKLGLCCRVNVLRIVSFVSFLAG